MKVFVTSRLPEQILNRIYDLGVELDYEDSNIPLPTEKIIERLSGVEVLICPLSDKITREVIENTNSKDLKLIANYGAGFDNVDIVAAKENGIAVTNAPAPSSAVSTAELTFALMLASARKLVQGEKDLRSGNFFGWRPTYFLGDQLKGKTLGIIGMGNIGKNLAKRALAFDMNVIYYSRNRKEDVESLGAEYLSKEEVIKNSDFLSLHTAFAPELRHMIGESEFKKMKPTSHFINAARGPLVDEQALVKALKDGEIRSAALDVYEFEPRVTDELLELENVVLAPHLGNATEEARFEMGNAVVDNLEDFIANRNLRNRVN
ncbi:Lactate dehydrogenase [Peptoniphilus asaccharolyticus DSM 20463]|uniref:Lactate dehydrogenase n=1 Tax=Peptoniphilus asaccharolyticus DSM 20463 TaxID=573058 RepID=A0A1W1UJ46_PEPAS|nr:NAD(P)-dependent oxidoreductase [Peptoniphilus asaccharolyticus]MBL7574763.1 NAD(P)-binding domain-containing protein [Peptoniphilus asaccharolyticus]SMB80774.1 Lactate dehydrogenase [Peptoniphilus asaccharolyticus DSM 20463]